MEIDPQTQLGRDFDWFCVDRTGAIGHFTTAGFKQLPQSVAESAEDLDLVTKYFEDQCAGRGGYELDNALALEIPDEKSRGRRYLRSFVAMADKGLYSFDIATYLEPNSCYFRVACPNAPLRSTELPEPIRRILERTVLSGRLLSDSSRISYEETLCI